MSNYFIEHDPGPEAVAPELPTPPARIDVDGRGVFHVKDLDAWYYHERGVFATGRWNDSADEVDVIIPERLVGPITLDYKAKVFREALDALRG